MKPRLLATPVVAALLLLPPTGKAEQQQVAAPSATAACQTWPDQASADCPFPKSALFGGVAFTGRHAEYTKDVGAYEFFAGHDAKGEPVWVKEFSKVKPLLEWNDRLGCVTATWNPVLKRFLMCVTDAAKPAWARSTR